MRYGLLMLALTVGCANTNETDETDVAAPRVIVVFDEIRDADVSPLGDVTVIGLEFEGGRVPPFDKLLRYGGNFDAAVIISAAGDASMCAPSGDTTGQDCIDDGLPRIFGLSAERNAPGCGDPGWPVERLQNVAEATGGRFFPMFGGDGCTLVDLDPIIADIAASL